MIALKKALLLQCQDKVSFQRKASGIALKVLPNLLKG